MIRVIWQRFSPVASKRFGACFLATARESAHVRCLEDVPISDAGLSVADYTFCVGLYLLARSKRTMGA
jgi:hypothetical protein